MYMKKIFLLSIMLIASILRSSAYTTITVQDSISVNTHWTCGQQYLLKGYVYVTSGATLTIDPGVIIKGDKDTKGSLIVERGAKIMAMGTITNPIVFTSNQEPGTRTYGDWGGVILCGYAPTNWNAEPTVEGGPRSHYGGTNPHDNSGEMHYVRIEFPGIAFSPNNEINGLTFCGVGDATRIDHIQVSYSGDDSYEWFGGNVNAKYIVAFAGWDDDFDTDNGYQGLNQFCAGVRDPFAADQSGSKAFESDSYQTGTYNGLTVDSTKMTRPVFSNVTAIGPLVSPTSTAYDPQFVAGAHIRRGSAISILNSIIAGFPCGVLIDESSASFGSTVANIASNQLQFRNNIIAGIASSTFMKEIVFVKDGARSLTPTTANADTTSTGTDWTALSGYAGPWTWLTNSTFRNKIYPTEQTGVRLGNPFNLANPGLVPTSTSPVVYKTWTSANGTVTHTFNPTLPISYDTTGDSVNFNVPGVAPDFTNSKASNAFFTHTNYVGAFAGTSSTTDNWMNGWCEFNPQNADYTTTCFITTGITTAAPVTFDQVKVFPNPAYDKATVLINVLQDGPIKITVSDLSGKVVKEVFNGETTNGTRSFSFSTLDLSSGLYMITILTDSKVKTVKLSIAK